MAALLREVCQLHREMVPGAEIAERLPATPMPMTGDAKLLLQVFSNLLSNAVKYSPGGGKIEVEAAIEGNEVVVVVADRGIGIPRAISIGCLSAIIAAATSPELSAPASVCIWSRLPLTFMAAALRCRARKAAVRVFAYGCRSSVPLKEAHVGHRRSNRPKRWTRRQSPPVLQGNLDEDVCGHGHGSVVGILRHPLFCRPNTRAADRCSGDSAWIGRCRSRCRAVSATTAYPILSAAIRYCSDHCGSDYQFYFCSRESFGCCRVGFGYCDWNGLLRCHP